MEDWKFNTPNSSLSSQYNNFAQTFSASRQNMKWPEIEYSISQLDFSQKLRFLDIGCGNWRLLDSLEGKNIEYIWVDASEQMVQEAKRLHPTNTFFVLDMTKIEKLILKDFDVVFFIASFHHLPDFKTREATLQWVKNLLKDTGKIFMINWNLLSGTNAQKYKSSKRQGSENVYLSADFDIKIWEHMRYYHWFHLDELEEIVSLNYKIIENRIFDWENNIITIAQKKTLE